MPTIQTLDSPRRWTRTLLRLATLLLCSGAALYLGWLHGQDQAIATAAQRAQRAAAEHERQLHAEAARIEAAQAIAAVATQRAAAAQRQLRLARAELRELRNAALPLDTATGEPVAASCPSNAEPPAL